MTSGTSPALCQATGPIDVERALGARPGPPDKPLNYREEIYHPAITFPVVTGGWFEVGKDGSLIRHQTKPDNEVTRIGENFISQRRDSEGGETNIFPIPSSLAPLLSSLRNIVGQTAKTALMKFPHRLETGTTGWRLSLQTGTADIRDNPPDTLIVLEGCGDQLRSLEMRLPGLERRRIVFVPAS